MLSFYRFTATLLLSLVIVTGLVLFLGYSAAQIKAELMPQSNADIVWQADVEPDERGGDTTLNVHREDSEIDYDFFLSSKTEYPYTSYTFNFMGEHGDRLLTDLSKYNVISFRVHCEPRNIMLFVLFTHDDKTTDINDGQTYRVNSTFFTCDRAWRKIVVQLNNLDTPDWWLQNSGLELVDRDYRLDKVISFGLVNSLQSPRDRQSNIKISDVELRGEQVWPIYIALALCAVGWLLFLIWFLQRYFKELVRQVQEKMRQDRPLVAYQKLTIEPQKDKEKSSLLVYLATNYSNPDLNLELVVTELGLNRNKINEILKNELDLTFTAYVNKLRLTEAARLLVEQGDMNIAQIAYAVGFNNPTYFNKLFKNEYGCTPKRFKDSCD